MPNNVVLKIIVLSYLMTQCAASQTGGQAPSASATRPSEQSNPLAALEEDLYQRGIETCDKGRWDEALPIHQRLTVLDPDYGFGWMGLGWSRQYTGDAPGAVEAYRRVLRLGGMPPGRVWLQIAECHVQMGELTTAMQDLEAAAAAGLPGLDRLRERPSLAPLRADARLGARFRELTYDIDTSNMSRQEGWAADLRILERELRRLHLDPLRRLSSDELANAVRQIESAVAHKSDEQLQVEVMALLRRIGDGHTWGRTPEQSFDNPQALPVLIAGFTDGLFITAADEAHRDLVWARIEQIEDRDPQEVLEQLDGIVSCDNQMRLLSQGPSYMRFPGILKGLGLARSASELRLTVTDATGARRETVIAPGAAPAQWIRAPDPDGEVPLPIHMKRRSEYYWFERLEDTGVVYFQYNACAPMEDRPLPVFVEELMRAVEAPDVHALVIDLRWNGGGNLFVSRPILDAILRSPKLARPGALYVIAGRHTFSAGMVLAAQLERYTPTIFVGEPTGSSPNFVGETNLMTLPYSRMVVSISNLRWQNSTAQDHRPWIPPRIRTPMSFRYWKQGRDESVEAILEHVSASASRQRRSD